MGKTSAAVKYKYNSKAYDRLAISVKKGDRERIKSHAEHSGESLNAYVTRLIYTDMGERPKE